MKEKKKEVIKKQVNKKPVNKKKIIVFLAILFLVLVIAGIVLIKFVFNKPKVEPKKKPEQKEIVKEKVDIIDVDSKTRPLAVSVNNTPVAVKVQTGLNKAYIVYEIPTEGFTSRLIALFKDVEDTKVGTIRSARHNMLDFAYESDAILTAYGWSHYAQDDMQKSRLIDYVQGMWQEGEMWRENPEHLASEHTVYMQTQKVYDYASSKKGIGLESDNTILLNYDGGDIDLSKNDGNMVANRVTLPYGNITTVFTYNPESKMYTRVVNDRVATDYFTGEEFNTKNIIIEKLTYNPTSDNHYWDLHTVGSGDGYYVTNGFAVPIKWSKESRQAKTKYTYLDGNEIEVSDGRTYIEVQITSKSTTIE